MAKYAVIDNSGAVINTVEWDGDTSAWQPDEPNIAVACGDDVAIGHSYADGVFAAPAPVVVVPSPNEVLNANSFMRDGLLSIATQRIGPLQDAVDLGDATADETAQLTAWKKYRVALNRVDLTQWPAAWPTQPEA